MPAPGGLVLIPLLVCLAAAPVARGTSSGEGIWVCRADADNLGCRSGYMMMTKRVCPSKVSLGSLLMQPCHDEQVENRGACLDEPADQSIMPWTRAPQPSAHAARAAPYAMPSG